MHLRLLRRLGYLADLAERAGSAAAPAASGCGTAVTPARVRTPRPHLAGVVVMVRNEIESARLDTIARRAERGLGVAIRDRRTLTSPVNGEVKPSPTDFATPSELSGANVARKCRCLDCRRPLRVAKSVATQRGPVCRSRSAVVA
jgi:hypothetical protein